MMTRKQMVALIMSGQSVNMNGKLYHKGNIEELPSEAVLTKGDNLRRQSVRAELESERRRLEAELAELNAAQYEFTEEPTLLGEARVDDNFGRIAPEGLGKPAPPLPAIPDYDAGAVVVVPGTAVVEPPPPVITDFHSTDTTPSDAESGEAGDEDSEGEGDDDTTDEGSKGGQKVASKKVASKKASK